jgi:heparosan-N-sulfate-glucuronate 5-epimerase
MRFDAKADYTNILDDHGVPMLDYHGAIGRQYNPIAIAQYALGNHTLWLETHDQDRLDQCLAASDWLVDNLEPNESGIPVWLHKFDWEYAETLENPWYSGLAQGQGISALLRAHTATSDPKYLEAAHSAFISLDSGVDAGGVLYENGDDIWIEEYIVTRPTHILNGYIWALWGVRDYHLATDDPRALELWERSIGTLERNLESFDLGYWSLYDQSASGRLKMIASNFYHQLHITQLQVMYRLTGKNLFNEYSIKWASYSDSATNRTRAKAGKALFKLLNY